MFTFLTDTKTSLKEKNMNNFWDYSVWSWMLLFAVLLGSLILGNILKKSVPFLRNSLIPTSVIGGLILLVGSAIYRSITGEVLFDSAVFEEHGMQTLEIITYHTLALGFIASSFKTNGGSLNKKRMGEIINTGVTTVSTYLLQGILGLGITIIAAFIIKGFFSAAGLLLPFGFGQGTGQALNYGNIYEVDFGFVGGRSFGLTIAALGFLSASLGGVIHLNIMKRKGKIVRSDRNDGSLYTEQIDSDSEIPMLESIDKMTIQIALIIVAYAVTFLVMTGLGNLLPGMKSVIFGFNFLLGVIFATLIKLIINFLLKCAIFSYIFTNIVAQLHSFGIFIKISMFSNIGARLIGESIGSTIRPTL